MSKKPPQTHVVHDPAQRKALASPLRLEILGLFTSHDALAVSDMAERMGRPAASLYYHVRMLERVGLFKQVGTRPSGRREEVLYAPIAERFAVSADPESGDGVEDAVKTLATAFRMAERDLAAAIQSPDIKAEGPLRNTYGTRVHARFSKDELRAVNRHLREIEKIILKAGRKTGPGSEGDQFLSLTLALLPLRGRHSD